jgi:signal recognition particle subunit SRP68
MGLLATVRSARSSYGIRHQDYERYRQYCSRKLARARSTKQNKDPRILEIFLFEAERAWAYAMQLRKEPNPRAQFHLIKRLRKAVKSSRLLQSQAQELQLDFKEQLEISVFCAKFRHTLF